jgi:pimeloyl-ACP methyl ester carboxylesterase
MSAWTHRIFEVNGIRLHGVEAGRGDLVVLLHGFPEFWYSWRHQLPVLAEAGFHVLAVDLRGYNESDRPAGVHRYRVAELVADVAALIRQSATGRAFVAGHDWGGVLAWRLAARHPELVRKLAILNAPHPAALRDEWARNFGQRLRSAYVYFFQLPGLPELLLRAWNFALLERAWRREPVHAGAFRDVEILAYKRALSRPGRLTGPLDYYRAALRYPRDLYGLPQQVHVPTLLIWGERDPYLGVELTTGLDRWVRDLRVVRIPDASHWVQNDVPDRVNRLLIEFFRGDPVLSKNSSEWTTDQTDRTDGRESDPRPSVRSV